MNMNKNAIQDFVSSFKKQCDGLLTLLYPRRCPACDAPVPYGQMICRQCEKACVPIVEGYCMKCGKPLHNSRMEYCGDCVRKTHRFARGRAVFVYQGAIVKSLYRFKYGHRQEYAAYYGKVAATQLGEELKMLGAQLLVPVPLHPKRYAKRGYNQAAVFANALSEHLHIPVCENAVVRVKNTIPQKLLDEQGRQNNLKKAFKVGQNVVKSKVIIVIDDIYTTGSTIDAVSDVLYRAGARKVYFLTLAIGREG